MRWGRPYLRDNHLQDAVEIVENLIVPETYDAVAAPIQLMCSPCIVIRDAGMLAAIDLDHQPVRRYGEVGDVGPDRMLTTDL